MKLSALIFIVFVVTFAHQVNAQDKWQIADEATVRLKPAAFSQLPKNIVSSLQKTIKFLQRNKERVPDIS
jgi:hypothetical protein